MKTVLHMYTDGGYNNILNKSYYGFVLYEDNNKVVNILNIKTKKAQGLIDFEQEALYMGLEYLSKSNICKILNAKIVVHTEILIKLSHQKNDTILRYQNLLGEKNVSFEYCPAHEYDFFNILIDILISDNNTKDLVRDFTTRSVNAISNIVKTYVELNQKGIINMFLIVFKLKLEALLIAPNIKKEQIKVMRETYQEFYINKTILYKGKKFIY